MVINSSKQIMQVKNRWYGATGEEFVLTEDGTIWKTEIYPSDYLSGKNRRSVLVGDKVIEGINESRR